MKSKSGLKTLLQVIQYSKKFTVFLLFSLLLTILTVALTLYIPILTGDAIDLIVEGGGIPFDAIFAILTRIGLIVLFIAVVQWILNVCNNRMALGIVRTMRHDVFQKIQSLPLSYLDTHKTGELVNRVIADIDQFSEGLLMGFTQFFSGIMTILFTLLFMLSINVKITLVVVLITPLSLFVAMFIAKRTYSLFTLQSKIRGEQTALIDEMVGNHDLVAAFHYEDDAIRRFDKINDELKSCSLKAIFFSSITNPSTRFVNGLVYAGVALVGALTCLSGGVFTVGQLSCFLSYANQYTKPFNEISGVITELQNALACASQVFRIIYDEVPEMPDAEDAVVLREADGEVTLSHVSFSYTPDRPLIEDLNLRVSPGQHIAIVGPTGCGKTTLINLLMRFYEVKDGAIAVSGHDIRDITRQSLRAHYGMVLQDTWLKSGTIRENLALGRPEATDEEIVAAAKAAHAHSFIEKLPHGYNTVIEENDPSISQGQKQLLCIARVMLILPPMLILDEATSSIDTRTEIKIQRAFNKIMEGRTTFIVAHRLSTIKEADLILVMNNGNIVEQGRHEELLNRNGFYAKLYNSQFET